MSARKVNQKLKLATTAARGKLELEQARSEESTSLWPEAHFLAPLHPVVDWASDRALAKLGRNEVFAVRGDVEEVSVLLQGTLTNLRGQVVASSFMVATYPNPSNLGFAPVEPFPSAAAALAAITFTGPQVNAGALTNAAGLTRFIAPAVRAGDELIGSLVSTAESATTSRISRWSSRTDSWATEAGALIQRSELRDRRQRVEEERRMAERMRPDRRLVRPLLLVVPRAADLTSLTGSS